MFFKIQCEFKYHSGSLDTMNVIRDFESLDAAKSFATSDAKEAMAARSDEFCQVRVSSVAPVKTGRTWKVTMDGMAHLYNSEDELVDREDMHKVLFVDALDMYDAEQIAYRIWERQVKEDGWNGISIYRVIVGVPKIPMTDRRLYNGTARPEQTKKEA